MRSADRSDIIVGADLLRMAVAVISMVRRTAVIACTVRSMLKRACGVLSTTAGVETTELMVCCGGGMVIGRAGMPDGSGAGSA
jgi:hypothetical protein